MGTDIHAVGEVFRDGHWSLANVEIPDDRNYWAFAVLADVRNGYGFAGVDTGDCVTPIDEPRGLPDDMSPELVAALNEQEIWLGDHSFSHVTLKELLDYDMEAPLTQRGMVTKETARRFREEGVLPSAWAGWLNDPEAERIQWQVPIREAAWLLTRIIDVLRGLGEPPNVRLVFGFDS